MMSDLLMRDDAPISAEVWEKIDDTVVSVFKRFVVGRKLIPMLGPVGWGFEQTPLFKFTQEDGAYVTTEPNDYVSLKDLQQEFMLRAKQLFIAQQTPFDLDLGAVALAAMELAKAEDRVVLGGLVEKAGCHGELGDWNTIGGPFAAVAGAVAQLRITGFDGPYGLVLSPTMFARLASLMEYGRREIDMVQKLVTVGIYQWPDMDDDKVIVLSPQSWNMDMVVGQDVVTAWLGNEKLDHLFRVFESVALRVKRPGGICVLQ
jgi:uncharacterized linocin/CFP29 family protein